MTVPERTCVLVVDDDADVRQLYERYLESDYRVRTAASGEAALEALDGSVDVVLLDRRLVDLSGADVLERLRADGFDQPVAMVTAVEPDIDIVDMGFDDYVVKPVDGNQLRDLVETLHLRREYDDVIREYFALVSKVTALERGRAADELDANEAYATSADRLEEIKDQAIAALEAAIDVGKFDELFQDSRFQREDIATPTC